MLSPTSGLNSASVEDLRRQSNRYHPYRASVQSISESNTEEDDASPVDSERIGRRRRPAICFDSIV